MSKPPKSWGKRLAPVAKKTSLALGLASTKRESCGLWPEEISSTQPPEAAEKPAVSLLATSSAGLLPLVDVDLPVGVARAQRVGAVEVKAGAVIGEDAGGVQGRSARRGSVSGRPDARRSGCS